MNTDGTHTTSDEVLDRPKETAAVCIAWPYPQDPLLDEALDRPALGAWNWCCCASPADKTKAVDGLSDEAIDRPIKSSNVATRPPLCSLSFIDAIANQSRPDTVGR